MCSLIRKRVGGSSVPAVIEIRAGDSSRGCQNRFPPQRLQKPRFARSEDRYQRRVSDSVRLNCSSGVLVAATK